MSSDTSTMYKKAGTIQAELIQKRKIKNIKGPEEQKSVQRALRKREALLQTSQNLTQMMMTNMNRIKVK